MNFEFLKKKFFIFIILLFNINQSNSVINYLDTSFGPNATGIVVTNIAEKSIINSITFHVDNKIVAAGSVTINDIQNLVLVRYNLDGTLDKTFGTFGITTLELDSQSYANSVAIDSNNKIVVAGLATINSNNNILLARFNEDGSPDLDFGIGGKVFLLVGDHAGANSVKVDINGKILVAGTVSINQINNIILARFNNDGSLDNSFANSGILTLTAEQGYVGNCLRLDQNSKIIIGGTSVISTGYNFLIVRINPDGLIDTTFGNNGIVTTSINNSTLSAVRSIFIDSQNRIVVGGFSGNNSNQKQFTTARYNNDGSLDATYGSFLNGYEVTSIGQNSEINSIVNLNDNIIATGTSDNKFAVASYTANGSLDLNFGINGLLINQIGRISKINTALLQDSRLLVGGFSDNPCCSQFTLAKYNKNNSDFINILSLNNEQVINSKIPTISGSSSGRNLSVQVVVNGNLLTTVNTDNLGNWNAGSTNVLPIGVNTIQVNLLSGSDFIVSEKININVTNNNGEDSIFAYSEDPQTKQDSQYSPIPFNVPVKLGTWSYANSVFTCNQSGTYLIEYSATSGISGITTANSIDVAMMIAINGIEYSGSESNATLDLNSNFTRPLFRSFVKELNAGETISLNFAVNIVGNNSGFVAGLMASANKIGLQPVYSLNISRIS